MVDNFKYKLFLVLSLGSLCSIEAMDQEGPMGQIPEGLKRHVITQGEICKLIRDGHAKGDYMPYEALSLFQQAYDKADLRIWQHGLKDGKLVKVICFASDDDQADPHDVKVWKLLLDKVDSLCEHTHGIIQEKAALLCVLTARKYTAARCDSLSLAQNLDIAWQAETLEGIRGRTTAERLANARDAATEHPEHSALTAEYAKRQAKKSKKIGEIIADREMLLAQLKKQEAVTRYEEQLAQAESMEK